MSTIAAVGKALTMPTPLICPDVAELKQLVLGQLTPEQITSLQEHLAICPACLAIVGDLPADDPLLRALESKGRAPGVEDELVELLIERLRALGGPAMGAGSVETPRADPAASANTPSGSARESFD